MNRGEAVFAVHRPLRLVPLLDSEGSPVMDWSPTRPPQPELTEQPGPWEVRPVTILKRQDLGPNKEYLVQGVEWVEWVRQGHLFETEADAQAWGKERKR